ncbi:glycoside hydrolase family 3 N-terminal domain-containing protein [Lawsonibacter faecis]|uniref:beta-glucosidase n=1 Tax=Lawsonibacter faecis TaxID=2763052 RepID=A0A8J6J9P1_9FIRM|nr:glycoside hydrolase family 3 N-terminal domain-containing protein [Lawsonibacter faecis]MBC5738532.1 glycoside hydrolase family 3 C-terminal domain-containing protein [Lawsonibacter faecis]
MKKQTKQTLAALLAGVMLMGTISGCTPSADNPSPSGSGQPGPSASAGVPSGQVEELGSGTVKWSEEKTADGWMKVTNEGGATLGYSPDSGVKLIQVDGYAFKDLNRNGELDGYEDWRRGDEERAVDLAGRLSAEEIAPMLTQGGWSSFGGTIEGSDLEYIQGGGRAGTSRSAAMPGNTANVAEWVNALQALCEATGDYGVPATVSTDPTTISGIVGQNALAATFDTELVHEMAVKASEQYRAVGVTMLLGPQIDLASNAIWFRTSGTYSEDPALNRDLAAAYIDGMQSTFDESGNDLGWGEDSVVTIVKHFVATGASEGGRDDHSQLGKYMIFPGDNLEAHMIPFFDGAFNLPGKTETATGLMPSYGILYDEYKTYGEFVGNAFNEFTLNLLRDNGFDGFIVTDWGITGDGRSFGVDDMTVAERFAALYKVGNDQIGGTTDLENAVEGAKLLLEDMGEEEGIAHLRESARRFFTIQMHVGLFDNPYVSKEKAVATAYTDEAYDFGRQTQEASIVMLKNSDDTIHEYDPAAEKATVYIPYVYQKSGSKRLGYTFSCKPSMDLDLAAQYYNVVTDTLGDPTGTDKDGKAVHVAEDIIRASAADIAACDYAIVSMRAPFVQSTYDEDSGLWLPASLQYEQYTANGPSVKQETVAGDMVKQEIDTGDYGMVTQDVKENRSYYGNTAAVADSYNDYETLQYVHSTVSNECKVIVVMDTLIPLVWSEVEPMADAILLWFNGYEGAVFDPNWFQPEALMNIITGQVEPSALLPYQMPKDMDDAEGQLEDVPRDMECYTDSKDNTYDFGFGMNWSGVISDERTAKYSAPALTEVEADIQY